MSRGSERLVGDDSPYLLARLPTPKTTPLTLPVASGTSDPLFLQNVMQPTFRPHRKKRARKIGYRARMATRGGRKVIKSRRLKGRKRLTVV